MNDVKFYYLVSDKTDVNIELDSNENVEYIVHVF